MNRQCGRPAGMKRGTRLTEPLRFSLGPALSWLTVRMFFNHKTHYCVSILSTLRRSTNSLFFCSAHVGLEKFGSTAWGAAPNTSNNWKGSDENDCPICFDPMDVKYFLQCKHAFHEHVSSSLHIANLTFRHSYHRGLGFWEGIFWIGDKLKLCA